MAVYAIWVATAWMHIESKIGHILLKFESLLWPVLKCFHDNEHMFHSPVECCAVLQWQVDTTATSWSSAQPAVTRVTPFNTSLDRQCTRLVVKLHCLKVHPTNCTVLLYSVHYCGIALVSLQCTMLHCSASTPIPWHSGSEVVFCKPLKVLVFFHQLTNPAV